MMNSMKTLIGIVAAAFVVIFLHATCTHAEPIPAGNWDYPPWLTRYGVGEPCDSAANCEEHLCCVRMTEREGNKCQKMNSTFGAHCSTTHWPRHSNIRSYLGGCPCGPGFTCETNGQEYGTCEFDNTIPTWK